MKKIHILVISQYFYPEQFRINDMCQEWVRRGYRVTVLTGIPNYPQGKFYEGYGYTEKRSEKWNGIEIIRIPLLARGSNVAGLIANYLSFSLSGFIWHLSTKIRADYVFTFEVSPMTQALVGVWYSKRYKVPHYLYVQDLWPENVETVTGIRTPLVIQPIEKMVDYIYKNCTDIFATSPSFVKAICTRRERVPKEKVHYWPQYAEDFYQPLERKAVEEIPEDDTFKVIFTGNVGYAQGLHILLGTAEILKEKKLRFVIVGDGRYLEELRKEISNLNVEKMFLLISRQPSEKIPKLLAACDVAFLSFMDTELFEMTIPARLQSYMACGMPIIASASGETKRIIERAECGICSLVGSSEKLAEAITTMMNCDASHLKLMGENSRKYFEQNFDKKKLMDKMDKMFTR